MIGFVYIIDAIFVLPFRAGRVSNTNSHDGTITGPVLFTSILAIFCQIFVLSTSEKSEHLTSINVHDTLITILAFLAVLCCIVISIYSTFCTDTRKEIHNWSITIALEIRFYWLFSLACMVYYAMKMSYHIDCFNQTHLYVYIPEAIVHDMGLFLFYFFQTGFFTRYLHYEFVHRVGIYYGLLILGVTNLSIFCREFALVYNEQLPYPGNNDTTIDSVIDRCKNLSANTYGIFEGAKPFLHPAIFEYSLLTMIFLTKVWPKAVSSDEQLQSLSVDSENVYNNIDVGESSHLLRNARRVSQTDFALLTTEATSGAAINRRTWKFMSISLAVILHIPALILHVLQRLEEKWAFVMASVIYNITLQLIMLFLNVRCFYMIRSQCTPLRGNRRESASSTANRYLLLTGTCGIMSYYTIVLYSRILNLPEKEADVEKLQIVLDVCCMISTYLQTIFLLQMKFYHKTTLYDSWKSIEYLCLFLAVENLASWTINTFVDSKMLFKKDTPYIFYGDRAWKHLFRFWFPFIIFYRFKCFVLFYSYFHMLK